MTIGKLNTFHFFPYSGLTFNEKVEAGIERGNAYYATRFCDPIVFGANTDLIRVQVFNVAAVFIRVYIDGVYFSEGALAETSGGSGIWEINNALYAPTVDTFLTFQLGTKPAGIWTPAFRTDPIFNTTDSFGTVLCQVSNKFAYAGMSFTNDQVYGIRVDAKFYEERNVDTNESEVLSDGTVVKLASSVKRQKFLEIEPLPPYMLHRVALLLKCNTLAMDGDFFIQEETYQDSKINDRFGLFLSNVWLTFKNNNYDTNVYGASLSNVDETGSAARTHDCSIGVTNLNGPNLLDEMNTYLGSLAAPHREFLSTIEYPLLPATSWADSGVAWSSKTSTQFVKSGTGAPGADLVSCQPCVVLKGQFIALEVQFANPGAVSADVFFYLANESGVQISSGYTISVAGTYIFILIADSRSVSLCLSSNHAAGVYNYTVTLITPLGSVLNTIGPNTLEIGDTYIGSPLSASPELVFADSEQGSKLTYIGNDNNEHPGWGCILDPCAFTDANRILWDDRDGLHWDDDERIDND